MCIKGLRNACSVLKNHITESCKDEVEAASLWIGLGTVPHCLNRIAGRAVGCHMRVEIGEFAG
jgi:hypothetical protein